jgi:hypothetical protein
MTIAGADIGAFADSPTTSNTNAQAQVAAGTMSELANSNNVSANPVTLNGSDQLTSYTLPLTVTDARGSGAGWNLTISSTQFSDGSGHTLPTSASSISVVTMAHNGTGTYTDPNNTVSYTSPIPVPAGANATPVKFFNATANTGLGSFTITPSVSIAIPANTYAGTYTSTVSVAVVSGP